jgi:hypothetical protein
MPSFSRSVGTRFAHRPTTMSFLRRWNFIERARLERQLWDAFERRDDLDALVERCRAAVRGGERSQTFQLEVWQSTLERIRRLEKLMKDQRPPGPDQADPGP